MDTSTRSFAAGLYLIGEPIREISGSKLPSIRQVLSRFLYHHKIENKSIQESSIATTDEVLEFWERARISTRQHYHVVNKTKIIFEQWSKLKKNSTRDTETQKKNETDFVEKFNDLFDIAHANALDLITIDDDKEFLLAQREKGRRGYMGGVDRKLAKKEERIQEKAVQTAKRKDKSSIELLKYSDKVELASSFSFSSSGSSTASATASKFPKMCHGTASLGPSSSAGVGRGRGRGWRSTNTNLDSEFVAPSPAPLIQPTGRGRAKLMTSLLASTLDITKVSDRAATFVISAAADALGHDVDKLTLSRQSIQRARRQNRELRAEDIKRKFDPQVKLVVHWDGKLMESIGKTGKDDRLAICVSGGGVEKLLAVPIIPDGTGLAQANAVFDTLGDWNLLDRIEFMCTDTTASNTGKHSGAATLLKSKVGKDLLYLGCRHHIFELMVAAVWDALMAKSSGPDILLFKRFKEQWNSIDRTTFISGNKDALVQAQLPQTGIENLIKSIFAKLEESEKIQRDDYKELLELSLIFSGETPKRGVHFMLPGAMHRARWMAKIIYSLKIFLFREQFELTKAEKKGLAQFNTFCIVFYISAWFTASSVTAAGRRDLKLVQNLTQFRKKNEVVAQKALKSFSGHLWYLSEAVVGFAFFDKDLSTDIKTKMVENLWNTPSISTKDRIVLDISKNGEENILNLKIEGFVTSRTLVLFDALGISQDFLQSPCETWQENETYIAARNKARNIKAVNDIAERGIALIQDFNPILATQEEQKQFLLQVVEEHRQAFPSTSKTSIMKKLGRD